MKELNKKLIKKLSDPKEHWIFNRVVDLEATHERTGFEVRFMTKRRQRSTFYFDKGYREVLLAPEVGDAMRARYKSNHELWEQKQERERDARLQKALREFQKQP